MRLPLLVLALATSAAGSPDPKPLPPLLAEIDRKVREEFWDPGLKGVDWAGAVARAAAELGSSGSPERRDAVYERLLATLSDSHTFRMPAGFPERHLGTAGLRIGRDADGYAVKGVVPGSSAERAGVKLADRILEVGGKKYGGKPVNFGDLFFVFEGVPGTSVAVTWRPAGTSETRRANLVRAPEEAGDSLVWKSARVIERDGRAYGYLRLWGISAETALAVVDLLLDREEASRARPELRAWPRIEGLLLDIRANSGGYDPNILTTFLRGRWSAADYAVVTREGRHVVPPAYLPLPAALLVNSGTASAGEALALKFRTHGIGPIVGEETAGMASGGASAEKLSDGSTLWLSRRTVQDLDGKSYEGQGVPPDVRVADRPGGPGREDDVIETAIRALTPALGVRR